MAEKTSTTKPTLTEAAQTEAAARPVIGGMGSDATRQAELNSELKSGVDPLAQARADLAAGKISVETFNKIAGTHR